MLERSLTKQGYVESNVQYEAKNDCSMQKNDVAVMRESLSSIDPHAGGVSCVWLVVRMKFSMSR